MAPSVENPPTWPLTRSVPNPLDANAPHDTTHNTTEGNALTIRNPPTSTTGYSPTPLEHLLDPSYWLNNSVCYPTHVHPSHANLSYLSLLDSRYVYITAYGTVPTHVKHESGFTCPFPDCNLPLTTFQGLPTHLKAIHKSLVCTILLNKIRMVCRYLIALGIHLCVTHTSYNVLCSRKRQTEPGCDHVLAYVSCRKLSWAPPISYLFKDAPALTPPPTLYVLCKPDSDTATTNLNRQRTKETTTTHITVQDRPSTTKSCSQSAPSTVRTRRPEAPPGASEIQNFQIQNVQQCT